MSRHLPVRGSVGGRVLGVLVAAFLVFGAAACSSDSSSDAKSENAEAGDDSGGDSGADAGADSGSDSPESDGASNGDLPDGFPGDVPLPEFTKIDVIKRATDATPGIWSVLLTIDPTLNESGDDLADAYGQQLEAAGFTLDDSGPGAFQAENEDWEIHVHSAMDGTLAIATVPK